MAEALLRHLGGDRFEAQSAGSHPAGFVHPLAIEAMANMGLSMDDHVSKSWDEYATTPLDVVITVCDSAAGEACPHWHGEPITAHWSLPDPAHYRGSDDERYEFAQRIAGRLRTKIEALVETDWSSARAELVQRLGFLGEI